MSEKNYENKKNIHTCLEHVEQAIDDFVNEQEIAPEIVEILNSEILCKYCNSRAEYKICI